MRDGPEEYQRDHLRGRLQIPEKDRLRLLEAARQFRLVPTQSEKLLWRQLRENRLGVKFRRQHPIGPLVVDFCCPQLRLIVEIDGSIHQHQRERDAARQQLLEDLGYTALRLSADDVERSPTNAAQQILAFIRGQPHEQGPPSPRLGEGAGG